MTKIADRFRPFSHLPGTQFPLPFSTLGVQVFPAALVVLPESRWIPLKIEGPVLQFTATLDLEKGVITVLGQSQRGYFRYSLFSKNGAVYFFQDKGEALFEQLAKELPPPPSLERISFGSSKKLDWELVKRRRDLKEILPVWFRLGQMIPPQEFKQEPSLLQSGDFETLFHAGFSGIFYPESTDITHSGLLLPPIGKGENPFVSLSEGYKKIRSWLIQEGESCAILPQAPYPQGRAAYLKTAFGSVDFEWTKGRLRKVWIDCQKDSSFTFPKSLKSCRLKGNRLDLKKPLVLTQGKYFLDRFEE